MKKKDIENKDVKSDKTEIVETEDDKLQKIQKRNKILKRVSIGLIVFSVVASTILSLMLRNVFDDNVHNEIKTEMVEKLNIKSNDINYIRKLDYKFYEVIMDNGDVYTYRKDEKGKTVIRKVAEDAQIIETSNDK